MDWKQWEENAYRSLIFFQSPLPPNSTTRYPFNPLGHWYQFILPDMNGISWHTQNWVIVDTQEKTLFGSTEPENAVMFGRFQAVTILMLLLLLLLCIITTTCYQASDKITNINYYYWKMGLIRIYKNYSVSFTKFT